MIANTPKQLEQYLPLTRLAPPVLKVKAQGLSCVQIARRLNMSVAAVSLVLCEAKSDAAGQAGSDRGRDSVIGRKRS